MTRIVLALSSIVFGAALLASTGCGGSGGGSGTSGGNGGAGNTTTTTSGSFSASCCINGTTYDCPSQDADDACGMGDPSGCNETGTNPDGTCN